MSKRFSNEVWDWFKSLLIAVIIALLVRHFVVEIFMVEGGSMHPNLYNGERLVVNKFIYNFTEPERGEVVVFKYTDNKDFIKRVVGLPGETIEIDEGKINIDGIKLEEDYNVNRKVDEDFGPKDVPQGNYFVLGDNRESSKDSRSFGTISKEQIKGRASFVFWPPGELRSLK